jgi:hypothetical protein
MRRMTWLLLMLVGSCGLAAGETGAYRHVVIFQFKEGTPAEKAREIEAAFAELPKKVEAVKSFEWGTNVSPENMNPELTHCFVLTFASKEAIEKGYLHHPAHEAFVALIKPVLEKAVVVDYVAQVPGK